MTKLTTIYDVFSGTLKFLVNEKPLPGISRLTQFQKQPFSVWCRQLFEVVYDEMNDDYMIIYAGRSCESKMLAFYSKENKHCRSFTTNIPEISDSALKRLKKLHLLCQNGLMFQKQTVDVHVVSDFPEEDAKALFKKALPKLCYCVFQVRCYLPNQWKSINKPFFVLLSPREAGTEQEIMQECTVENYIIRLAENSGFRGISGMSYLDEACDQDLPMVIQEKLEFALFPQVLRLTMSGIEIEPSHAQYYNFKALDKVEPITVPIFPKSLELGEEKQIELRTIPEGASRRELVYRVSSDEVLTIQQNVMKGVGTGEVIVEAYNPGQSTVVASARMVVFRRNRITSIKTSPERVEMIVGDKAALRFTYEPKDADNTCTIRFLSRDGTIASIKETGEIVARKPGHTIVFAETDNKVRGSCSVSVFPVLEAIKVSLSTETIRCGEYCHVETGRVPAGATLDPLIFRVSPHDVAEYDAGSKIIVTKKPGRAVLTVTDSRNSTKTEVPFVVKKKGLFH